jgi:hypothetical protein
MAGRDRAVTQTAVRLPDELKLIIICYQNARRMSSFNQAVIELTELGLKASGFLDMDVIPPL